MASRLEKSLECMKPHMLLKDGRRPAYFALLDLASKPFWTPEECDKGVVDLVADLKRHRKELHEEAVSLKGKEVGDGWRVFTVCGDGLAQPAEGDCPKIVSLLRRHSSCVSMQCPFQASLVSVLQPRSKVAGHFGPTNFRLRLQFPLSGAEGCWIQCGKERSSYEE